MKISNPKSKFLNNKYSNLFLLIFIFFCLRLGIIYFNLVPYNLAESFRSTMASEILKGSKIPLFDMQATAYEGGSLVISMLAAVYYAFFGESGFVLRLVPLTVGIFILSFIYIFIYDIVNKKLALMAAFLFICSPPLITQISITAWGSHFESLFFTVLYFYILFRAIRKGYITKTISFLTGILIGFALYSSYTFLVSLVVSIFFILMYRKKMSFVFSRDKLMYVSMGFVIGFSPWFFFNLTHDFSGLDILTLSFRSNTIYKINAALYKGLHLFTDDLPKALSENVGVVSYSGWIYYILLLSGLVAPSILSTWNRKKITGEISICKLFLLYFITFIIVYSFSEFSVEPTCWQGYIGYRYLTTPIVFLTLTSLISFGQVTELCNKMVVKYAGTAFIIILLSTGAYENLKFIYLAQPGNVVKHRLQSYQMVGYNSLRKHRQNLGGLKKAIDLINKIDPENKVNAFIGLGNSILKGSTFLFDIYRVTELVHREIPYKYQPFFFEGLGRSMAEHIEDLPELISHIIDNLSERDANNLYMGLGGYWAWRYRDLRKLDALRFKYGTSRQFYYRSLGGGLIAALRDISLFKKTIEIIPESERPFFYQGLGLAYYDEGTWFSMEHFRNIVDSVPDNMRKYAYIGLGGAIFIKSGLDKELSMESFRLFDSSSREYLVLGLEESERRISAYKNRDEGDLCVESVVRYIY